MEYIRVRSVIPLQELCLRRVLTDTVRHAAKCKTEAENESSVYQLFQRMYSEDLVRAWNYFLSRRFESGTVSQAYVDTLNFIFNPYTEKILLRIPPTEMFPSVIAKNCKDLRQLCIPFATFNADIHSDFLKPMKSLVQLTLIWVRDQNGPPTLPFVKTIAESLEHLRFLSLDSSDINDNCVFLLCGHELPCKDSISVCSFVNNCSANCKLKLHTLNIMADGLSRVALACVLTHIPTLESLQYSSLRTGELVDLSKAIASISEQRKALNAPPVKFQLQKIGLIQDSRAMKTCLESCPKLKEMELNFQNESIVCRTVEENELSCLETVYIKCTNINQLFAEEFKSFWIERGSQLKKLRVSPPSAMERIEADIDVIGNILALCPRLTSLELVRLEFLSSVTKDALLEDYPELNDLERLILEATGETFSVNVFGYKLIRSAGNVEFLDLRLLISENIILPYLSKRYLLRLKCIQVVLDREGQPIEQLKAQLHRENGNVRIYLSQSDY